MKVDLWVWLIVGVLLVGSAFLGARSSRRIVILLVGVGGAALVLRRFVLGIPALIVAALIVPLQFDTGTAVKLNVVSLALPTLLLVWILKKAAERELSVMLPSTMKPLLLFLLFALISLLIGNIIWDPTVPRPSNFSIVQLAQWALFAFSAIAFLLTANLVDRNWLQRITFLFLIVGGGVACVSLFTGARFLVNRIATVALIRAPFWVLLVAIATGQLLFNSKLSWGWRIYCLLILVSAASYALVEEREAVSNWSGIAIALLVLLWLRWRQLRWLLGVIVVLLLVSGFLFPAVWEFAGGDAEWQRSGGARLALIEHVISVSLRNPVTGLGPAAYRLYAAKIPLAYGNALWFEPNVSSHNNYVDIFAQTGVLGLGAFLWFLVELGVLNWRLSSRFEEGFIAGFVNAMLATWVSIIALMMVLDWFLPFVYNVGFPGFQASVLLWIFFGALTAIEDWEKKE